MLIVISIVYRGDQVWNCLSFQRTNEVWISNAPIYGHPVWDCLLVTVRK
jgi:hypothetical protein